jgi:hypothetical protein
LLALGYVAASVVFGLGAFIAGASMLRGGGAP